MAGCSRATLGDLGFVIRASAPAWAITGSGGIARAGYLGTSLTIFCCQNSKLARGGAFLAAMPKDAESELGAADVDGIEGVYDFHE